MLKHGKEVCQRCFKPIKSYDIPIQARFVSTTIRSEIPQAGPSRSHIFDIPVEISTKPRSPFRLRCLKHYAEVEAARSPDESRLREKLWADPWYRMYRSPVRQCTITKQRGPNAFMVNLRIAQLDNSDGAPSPVPKNKDPTMYLLPDRILHPRHQPPKAGLGIWVTCHHSIIARLAGPGPHHGLLNTKTARVAPDLVGLVYEQLQSRIIQELSLLDERLTASNTRSRPLGTVDVPVIASRLTPEEASEVQAGRSPIAGAVAYLRIPILGAESTDLDGMEDQRQEDGVLPLDVSLPLTRTAAGHEIPLYPLSDILGRDQYTTVRKLVGSILNTERIARIRTEQARAVKDRDPPSTGRDPAVGISHHTPVAASDIIVIRSETRTEGVIRQGDWGVDLAVALYRLRCFLGQGWKAIDVDSRGHRV